MRLKVFCIVLAGLGALGIPGLAAAGSSSSIPARSSIDPRTAYTSQRWIGLTRGGGGDCPPVAGWSSERWLVEVCRCKQACPTNADTAILRETGLDRFCVYTAGPGAPAFRPPPGLVAAPDRMALSASADALDQKVSPVLAEHFLRQAGALTAPLRSGTSPTVQLTFVDNQPTSDQLSFLPPPPGSQHGYALAYLAHDLVCPEDGPCAATIGSQRALGYLNFDPALPPPPLDQSGNVGLVSDLAQAIFNQVLPWKPVAGGKRHLILNLSLGWDGELFGDLSTRKASSLQTPVRLVYQALLLAAKKGVLVIAAAGNRRGGPEPSHWPVLPAAWELRQPWGTRLERGGRLVYAVGGVDWQGLPLSNSRRGGIPRRAAYGDHGVASVNGSLTTIYTGTSVSTAVVSSIAAVIWNLRPDLRPAQVMELIDRSGDPLEARADFYPRRQALSWLRSGPPMQRASLCVAVRQACGPGAALCPALPSVPQCSAWDQQPPPLWSAFADTTPFAEELFKPTSLPASFRSICDPSTRLLTEDGHVPDAPCPADQFGDLASQRWVLPQPGDDPCPGCTLISKPPMATMASLAITRSALSPALSGQDASKHYTLALELDPSGIPSGSNLVSATIDIDRFVKGKLKKRMTYPLSISFDPASGASLLSVTSLGDGDSLMGCRAQINFVVQTPDGKTMSIQNPVVVNP